MTHRSKGFLTTELYVAAGAAVLILAMGGLAWLQTSRLDALRKEYAEFKGGVEALGRAAQAEADRKEKADKLRKETVDAENAAALATLASTVQRLRNASAGRSIVPAAPAATVRPDLACFDRAELERTLREYRSEIRGLADEGAACAVNLDSAKRWAAGL